MGTGMYGNIKNTKGAIKGVSTKYSSEDSKRIQKSKKVSFPNNSSQLKHIFSDKEGHLRDTKENRKILKTLANDKNSQLGKDKYGNTWNAKINKNGSQYWVRHKDGIINNGGLNSTPRNWDSETGLNNNPFKKDGGDKNDN